MPCAFWFFLPISDATCFIESLTRAAWLKCKSRAMRLISAWQPGARRVSVRCSLLSQNPRSRLLSEDAPAYSHTTVSATAAQHHRRVVRRLYTVNMFHRYAPGSPQKGAAMIIFFYVTFFLCLMLFAPKLNPDAIKATPFLRQWEVSRFSTENWIKLLISADVHFDSYL